MNAPPFDPYYQWLGISAAEQPPNHYRLLGLVEGESDPTMITAAADQRLAVIEAQRGGPEEQYCDAISQEIRAARDCLLDPGMRASYDAALEEARIPMAMPVAPPPPSELAASAPASPLAPPVASTAAAQAADDTAPSRSTAWAWIITLLSVIAMGVAVWLIVTSVYYDPADNPAVTDIAQGEPAEVVSDQPSEAELPPEPVVVMQEGTGNVVLRPILAVTSGAVELDETGETDVLSQWGPDGAAKWRFRIIKAAVFRVVVRYAAADAWDGAQFEIALDSQTKTVSVRSSGGVDQFHEDEYFLATNTSGEHEFTVRTVAPKGDGLMVLKSIQLEPRTGNLPK